MIAFMVAMASFRESPSSACLPLDRPSLSTLHRHSLNEHLHSSRTRVSIFWDLDNKPPKSPPFHAALNLRATAALFGTVVDSFAFANLHAFLHIPNWLGNPGFLHTHPPLPLPRPNDPSVSHYVCSFCGFSCQTKQQLKKHRKVFHNGERGARNAPLAGYGLGLELARAGFQVRTVDKGPQAADRALKRQMKHAMESGTQCVCLVSDDSGFSEILKKAKENGVITLVMGDTTSLKMLADWWFPWDDVAEGKCVSCDIHPSAAEGEIVKQDGYRKNTGKVEKYQMFYDFSSDFSSEEESEKEEEEEDVAKHEE